MAKFTRCRGRSPDLILFDSAEAEVQRIDLTRIRTTENIHKLLSLLGMREICRDSNPSCADWKKQDQCTANPGFMLQNCRLSCGVCAENASIDGSPPCANTSPDNDCEYWQTMGECTNNEAFMKGACARSCGVCQTTYAQSDDDDDDDKDEL